MSKPAGISLDALLTVEQFARWQQTDVAWVRRNLADMPGVVRETRKHVDRKSTRLNSSHVSESRMPSSA